MYCLNTTETPLSGKTMFGAIDLCRVSQNRLQQTLNAAAIKYYQKQILVGLIPINKTHFFFGVPKRMFGDVFA